MSTVRAVAESQTRPATNPWFWIAQPEMSTSTAHEPSNPFLLRTCPASMMAIPDRKGLFPAKRAGPATALVPPTGQERGLLFQNSCSRRHQCAAPFVFRKSPGLYLFVHLCPVYPKRYPRFLISRMSSSGQFQQFGNADLIVSDRPADRQSGEPRESALALGHSPPTGQPREHLANSLQPGPARW